jgi:hypothetical protein
MSPARPKIIGKQAGLSIMIKPQAKSRNNPRIEESNRIVNQRQERHKLHESKSFT